MVAEADVDDATDRTRYGGASQARRLSRHRAADRPVVSVGQQIAEFAAAKRLRQSTLSRARIEQHLISYGVDLR